MVRYLQSDKQGFRNICNSRVLRQRKITAKVGLGRVSMAYDLYDTRIIIQNA